MEASQATPEAGTEQTAPEGQEGAAQEQQAPDLSGLTERFDQMERSLGEFGKRFDSLDERIPAPEQAQEEGEEPYYVDPQTGQLVDEMGQPIGQGDDYFDPAEERERVRSELREEMQQQIAPLIERARDEDLRKLEERYPELQTREGAEPFVRAAQSAAEQLAGGSPEAVDFLLDNPKFVEMAYLAEKAKQRSEQETPAGAESSAQLETGSGSRPGEPEQPGVWDRLRESQSGNKFWGTG